MINELAKRVGLREYFWEDVNDALDYMVKPLGLTWEKFRDEVIYIHGTSLYDPEKVAGFKTRSGKVELVVPSLEKVGVDSLPSFAKLKGPLTGKFDCSDEYPLMMTNYKSEIFMLSGYRNVDLLVNKSLPLRYT